jgi:hypothetical protein
MNLEASADLSQAFCHARQSHAAPGAVAIEALQHGSGDTSTVISDRQNDMIPGCH